MLPQGHSSLSARRAYNETWFYAGLRRISRKSQETLASEASIKPRRRYVAHMSRKGRRDILFGTGMRNGNHVETARQISSE